MERNKENNSFWSNFMDMLKVKKKDSYVINKQMKAGKSGNDALESIKEEEQHQGVMEVAKIDDRVLKNEASKSAKVKEVEGTFAKLFGYKKNKNQKQKIAPQSLTPNIEETLKVSLEEGTSDSPYGEGSGEGFKASTTDENLINLKEEASNDSNKIEILSSRSLPSRKPEVTPLQLPSSATEDKPTSTLIVSNGEGASKGITKVNILRLLPSRKPKIAPPQLPQPQRSPSVTEDKPTSTLIVSNGEETLNTISGDETSSSSTKEKMFKASTNESILVVFKEEEIIVSNEEERSGNARINHGSLGISKREETPRVSTKGKTLDAISGKQALESTTKETILDVSKKDKIVVSIKKEDLYESTGKRIVNTPINDDILNISKREETPLVSTKGKTSDAISGKQALVSTTTETILGVSQKDEIVVSNKEEDLNESTEKRIVKPPLNDGICNEKEETPGASSERNIANASLNEENLNATALSSSTSRKLEDVSNTNKQEQETFSNKSNNNYDHSIIDALSKIESLIKQGEQLKLEIDQFSSTNSESDYFRIESELTNVMIELDSIEAINSNIKLKRKHGIVLIQKLLVQLDNYSNRVTYKL